MEIIKTSGTCVDCRKNFEDGFELDFNKKIFYKPKLCSCCACKLYLNLAGSFVPKSPRNIINRQLNHEVNNNI